MLVTHYICHTGQEADECRDNAIRLARDYLEEAISNTDMTVFETCISAYALNMVNSRFAVDAYHRMDALKHRGN